MGGLVGICEWGAESVNRTDLERMAAKIEHRGPKGKSFWNQGDIGFVHLKDRVLPSISENEQPLMDASGRYRIVCMGRVFNWQEIAKEISNSAQISQPTGCLETILSAYKLWGVEAFAKFNGGYACAIWDDIEKSVCLARDHFGMKPLYYTSINKSFLFATEIKALLAHPDVKTEPDDQGIADFLSVNRFRILTKNTCYSGIKKLLPGTWCKFSEGRFQEGQYWNIDPERIDEYANDEERIEHIRDIMVDAIDIRLPEGDHVGASLSGGFDSSSIVCVMRALLDKQGRQDVKLDTFSYDFETDEADEVHLIEVIAKQARSTHHGLKILQPDFFDDLDKIIVANDGPILENAALLLYKNMTQIGKAGVDVHFSGIGGDELFQGELNYFSDLFRSGHWVELYKEIRGVYPVDPITGKNTSLSSMLRGYLLSPLRPDWYQKMRKTSNGMEYPPDWMSDSFCQRANVGPDLPNPDRPRFKNFYDQSCWDLFYYELVGAGAHYHDTAGATFSIDSRCPLMDVRLVEAMFATPREWKIKEGQVRRMQKSAMEPYLPKEILEDHIKKDHHPTVTGFMQHAMQGKVNELLKGNKQLSRDYVDWNSLERHTEPYFAGKPYSPLPIWLAMALERWLQTTFGNE